MKVLWLSNEGGTGARGRASLAGKQERAGAADRNDALRAAFWTAEAYKKPAGTTRKRKTFPPESSRR